MFLRRYAHRNAFLASWRRRLDAIQLFVVILFSEALPVGSRGDFFFRPLR